MEFKIAQGVKLTIEQLKEVSTIMEQPDEGWESEDEEITTVILMGDFANYVYRINLKCELITLLEVNQ